MAKKWILPTLAAVAVAVGIVACGGGGGGGGANASLPISIVGTAATGSALTDGTVQIYGADGIALLSTPAIIASNGSYSATIPAGAKFPLVFVADDGSQKLVSIMASANDTAIVNVTQLTNLLASRLSPSGDPANLLKEIAAGTAVNASTVQSKITEMLAAIKPLLEAHGLSVTDNPVTKTFVANGSGYDKMLDTLDVKIEPKGSASTIELTVKKAVAEDAPLPNVTLLSSAAIPTLPTVNAAELPENGLTLALKDLLDQSTACYALAKGDRITTNGTSAADIKAQACKDMFDGKDPRNYKSGGHVVKSTDHFGGIFTASTPVTFSSPRYFYTISADAPTYPNGPKAGDVVFGYRWKDEYGNFQYERNVVRKDASDGKYRFIGNKYVYPGGTSAYAQRRNFLMQPNSTYLSVGYGFDLPCISGANNSASWKKVVVTTPDGSGRITLMPNVTGTTCNYSYFTIASKGTVPAPSGTGFIRIRSEFEGGSNAPSGHPRDSVLDVGPAFVENDFTDAQIEQIPQFGRWKYEYFLDANSVSTNTPNVTQYFRTVTRAMTIAGFKQSVKLPNLESAYQADLISSATPNCSATGCYVVPNNPFPVKWTVNAAAQALPDPPATYRVRIYGKYGNAANRLGYEDTSDVRSSVRTTSIACGNGDSTQQQCETKNAALIFATPSTGVVGARNYDRYTTVGNIDLVSRLPDNSDASHFYTLGKLVP